jgi:DNA polymerase V
VVSISFNEFIVSCERAMDSHLGMADLAVISADDGCVIASTKGAKLMGIEVGIPYLQVKPIVQMAGILIKISSHSKYNDISDHIMNILSEGSKSHELVSIDECFIEVVGEINEILTGFKKEISKRTGITVSIGVGNTKTLAKIANRVSTVSGKDTTTCIIDVSKEKQYLKIMQSEKMADVWNISTSQVEKLSEDGLESVHEFCNAGAGHIESLIGSDGLVVLDELNGKRHYSLIKTRKSIIVDDQIDGDISISKILKDSIKSFNELDAVICKLAKSAIKDLRKQDLCAERISVYAYGGGSKDSEDGGVIFTDINLSFASADYSIISLISEQLKYIFNDEISYNRVEICLSKLGRSYKQQDLFIEALGVKKMVKKGIKVVNKSCGNKNDRNDEPYTYNTSPKPPTFISNL